MSGLHYLQPAESRAELTCLDLSSRAGCRNGGSTDGETLTGELTDLSEAELRSEQAELSPPPGPQIMSRHLCAHRSYNLLDMAACQLRPRGTLIDICFMLPIYERQAVNGQCAQRNFKLNLKRRC